MTFRASGVVNVAHAAVGTFLAFSFYEFRETGQVVLPWPALPNRFDLVPRPTVATAETVYVVYGALLGLVLYLLVIRPLRRSPPLGRVVASIGLFLYFWAIVGLEWTITPDVRPILPRDNVAVLGRFVGVDRLLLGAMAAALAAALWFLATRTRFGLASTAAADDARGAALSGLDANRLAAANWMIATSSAGLAIICGAQVVPLDALNNSLLVVPALAAALLAGFRSYPLVAAAGLAIGMVQSELLNLQTDLTWLPRIGLQQGLPFLIILVVVALRGAPAPGRGEQAVGRFPAAPEARHPFALGWLAFAAAVFLALTGASDVRSALITTSIFAVLALSVVVLTGFVGQISLASYAFAGVAAFVMVKLHDAGVPFPLSPVLAALVTCGLGALVGLPAVRVRGLSLTIVTLGAAVAIQELLFRWEWFVGSVTGTPVPEPTLAGADLSIRAAGEDFPRTAFTLLCVGVLLACGLGVVQLRRGRTGLAWLAVRANERAAAAAGVDVAGAKLTAFAVSAFLAGIGGCLIAYQRLTVSADTFGVFNSLSLLALTYLAGIAAVSGGVVAGVLAPVGLLAILAGQDVGQPSPYQFAISGLALVAVAVSYPDGLTGGLRSLGALLVSPTPSSSPPAADVPQGETGSAAAG
jgi:branched-chain amino acid transport system permease protein